MVDIELKLTMHHIRCNEKQLMREFVVIVQFALPKSLEHCCMAFEYALDIISREVGGLRGCKEDSVNLDYLEM